MHDATKFQIDLTLNGKFEFVLKIDGLHDLARAVGIRVTPGPPFVHPTGENPMPKVKVSMVKASAQTMRSARSAGAAPAKAAGTDFVLLDNEDSSCTVQGVDAGGNPVDIASVATITAKTSDPATLGVDTPDGMKFTVHGLKPGQATVSVVATWNDGSIGPFSFDLPVSCAGTAATGITVTFGPPTVRP